MVRFNDLFGNRCCQGTYLTPSKAICTLYLSTVYFARWVILHTPNCESDLVCWQAAHAKPNGPWGGYTDHIAKGPTKHVGHIRHPSHLNSQLCGCSLEDKKTAKPHVVGPGGGSPGENQNQSAQHNGYPSGFKNQRT